MAVLTSEQDVEPFLNRETVASDLLNLHKDELLLISDYLELNFTKASKKADILAAVLVSIGKKEKESMKGRKKRKKESMKGRKKRKKVIGNKEKEIGSMS